MKELLFFIGIFLTAPNISLLNEIQTLLVKEKLKLFYIVLYIPYSSIIQKLINTIDF